MAASTMNPKSISGGSCKLTVKCGGRSSLLGCITNGVDSGNTKRQPPQESSKRRKVELERAKSCSPPEAAAASLATMHDLNETPEKLTYDLRNSVDRIDNAIFKREKELPESAAAAENKIPAVKGSPKGLQIIDRSKSSSSSSWPPGRADVVAPKVWERRTRGSSGRKKKRAKFSLSLTTEEVEKDFMKMIGFRRPLRRQKKRPKHLQKKLDELVPGMGLTEVTADLYKVPDDDFV
ncbi:hypothetical protein PIB30_052228 [Stylosanthes scabra]|uniref:Uncharacterized protein n=1 Tax=Stylosanthes scabra TaxID=79078 RepID=A0ABU6QHL8_9FABA|nr:hypothetical protein [Stylosanthes scabra]